MAKGTVNKVIVIGRLGANPQVRYAPSGMSVLDLTVATNDGHKDKNTGMFVDKTQWHRLTLFGKTAEIAGQYLKKGDMAYFEGRLQTDKWQDKTTGEDRYSTKIVVSEMQLLGGSSNNKAENPIDAPAPTPEELARYGIDDAQKKTA